MSTSREHQLFRVVTHVGCIQFCGVGLVALVKEKVHDVLGQIQLANDEALPRNSVGNVNLGRCLGGNQ